jgi:hypothetical protein
MGCLVVQRTPWQFFLVLALDLTCRGPGKAGREGRSVFIVRPPSAAGPPSPFLPQAGRARLTIS